MKRTFQKKPKSKPIDTDEALIKDFTEDPSPPPTKCCPKGRKKHVPKAVPASEPKVTKKRFPKLFKPNSKPSCSRPKAGVSGFADLVWSKKYDN
jgi:hypothetical protein